MSNDGQLTISAFARMVGLSPSALRFYDDCGLLRPAAVDDRTGYRYYSIDQQRTAVLVRRMRDIDLPLTQIRLVLDGDQEAAAAVLRAHVADTVDKADLARTVVEDLVSALKTRDLPDPGAATIVRIDGPELAGAVRQVAPAAARTDESPGLDGVLLEVTAGEITVVATDRYQLALRTLQVEVTGAPRRVLVPVADLVEVAGWARAHGQVELRVEGQRATLMAVPPTGASGDQRELTVIDDRFPTYRSIIDGLPPWITRVIVDRQRLLDFVLSTDPESTARLVIGRDGVDAFRGQAPLPVRLPAVCVGESMTVGFSPSLLAPALQAAVGPDALLELSGPNRPCVLRSADQGTFSTLVMPRRLPES